MNAGELQMELIHKCNLDEDFFLCFELLIWNVSLKPLFCFVVCLISVRHIVYDKLVHEHKFTARDVTKGSAPPYEFLYDDNKTNKAARCWRPFHRYSDHCDWLG